jgi:hypothetical protein
VEDVETIIIPFLDGVMTVEQEIVDTTLNDTAAAESARKLVQLQEAKNGWQSLLDRNWKLYQDARAGKMAKNAVTHLVAESLLQDDKGVDNVKYINGSQAPNADALRAISAIRSESFFHFRLISCSNSDDFCFSFGGVGATISYSESKQSGSEESASEGVSQEFSATLSVGLGMTIFFVGLSFGFEQGYGTSRESETSVTRSVENLTTRSFSLGDADDGDYFDVQV